jgi:hypothetical protein
MHNLAFYLICCRNCRIGRALLADPIFPIEFARTNFDRQTYMTDHFVADNAQVGMVKGIWAGLAKMPMPPPMNDAQILAFLQDIRKSTDKIKARGGQVIFVRTPSSGAFRQMELAGFARSRYWDKLLEVTGCPGSISRMMRKRKTWSVPNSRTSIARMRKSIRQRSSKTFHNTKAGTSGLKNS